MRFIPAIALGLLPLAAMAQTEAPDPEPPAPAEARLGALRKARAGATEVARS